MSEIFRLSAGNYLEWSVDKPFCDRERKSPTFSYLGNEWYFQLKANYHRAPPYSLYLSPVDDKKFVDKDAKLKVFIHLGENECTKYIETFDLEKNEYNRPTFPLHIYGNDDRYVHWHVYILFSTDLPSELHIKESETKHLVSNLPGSSSIVMKAKLATSAVDDALSDAEFLSTDFGKLLEQQSTSDVTLTCGDRTFSAHRIILAARSEVFAAMFQSKMIESETGSIDIKDIDGEVFELLLKYVYTGKISHLSVDIASSLYIAADKYSIQSLKNKCSKWMLGSLTEENCLDYLLVADTWNDGMLKDSVVNFVAETLHLLEEDEWQKFSDKHPKLAWSVYQRRVFTKSV